MDAYAYRVGDEFAVAFDLSRTRVKSLGCPEMFS
jgi:hypothetical protein